MRRRATKLEVQARRLIDQMLEEAAKSSDFKLQAKTLRIFIAYQGMILKLSQSTQKKVSHEGSGWDDLKKSNPELKKLYDEFKL